MYLPNHRKILLKKKKEKLGVEEAEYAYGGNVSVQENNNPSSLLPNDRFIDPLQNKSSNCKLGFLIPKPIKTKKLKQRLRETTTTGRKERSID